MPVEIERKFLVNGSFKNAAKGQRRIIQGYLNTDPTRTVRVRVADQKAFITIKGKGNESGMSRKEWEYEIPVSEAQQLLDICESGIIDKTRYLIDVGEHCFEVDEFYGENEGLILAEVELQSEDESFEKPNWLGEEVTGQNEYYNSSLMKSPYKTWTS